MLAQPLRMGGFGTRKLFVGCLEVLTLEDQTKQSFWSPFDVARGPFSFQKPGPFGVWIYAGAVRVVAVRGWW